MKRGFFIKRQLDYYWFYIIRVHNSYVCKALSRFLHKTLVHSYKWFYYLCSMSDLIVNKVANSGLITLDLETYLPKETIVSFDLKDHLFMGLILKEKEFREALKATDWQQYTDKYVAVMCSADAIIPMWAYMLVATYLQPVAKDVYVGTTAEMQKHLFLKNLNALAVQEFQDQRVVVKGCGDVAIDSYAYGEITKLLVPVVKSIMYGEPCSTVPVYKKK